MSTKWIIGVDEAGRGPLAGPVAIGLVRAPETFDFYAAFPGLNDSKQVTEAARERIFAELQKRVASGELAYIVRLKSHQDIDEKGIAVVIQSAIAHGLKYLVPEEGEYTVWLDGALRAPRRHRQETVIGGDALVPCIMLASIAAKVTRDRYMVKLARTYPAYRFNKHKGYGTSEHYALLAEHGPCAVHRQTFLHLDRALAEE